MARRPQRNQETEEDVPSFDLEQASRFGQNMWKRFEQYKKDRRMLEEQLIRNQRQIRGIYDPEILDRIPSDQSTAYPKFTRTKVVGTVARLMELLFPKTDKNWGVEPSPVPDIDVGDLQEILTNLQAKVGPEATLTDTQIEAAIREFTHERALRMEKEIEDILEEIQYPAIVRQVVRSGVGYCAGVVKGPLVRMVKQRTWTKNPTGSGYTAKEVQRLRPYYEGVSIWDYYPDMSAKRISDMDGQFQRHVMTRQQLRELADRPDFMRDQILGWLENHPNGNFVEQWWEKNLRTTGDKSNITDLSGRKYELAEWWGAVSGHDLEACGVKAPGGLSDMVEVNCWVIDNVVIKCVANPLRVRGTGDERVRPYHIFVYEEDDISLLGNGLPYTLRDSQMAICEAARMMLDNASIVSGPMLEIDPQKLMPGQDMDVYARKVWIRDADDPSDNVSAVREVRADSHIPELQSIITLFREILDNESALPPPALGDMSGSGTEPYRTSSGMSILMGNAALPIRDVVRNFDAFTISFINSLYYWLMQFGDNPKIRGDFSMTAKGSTSLIAKEVRAAEIDVFRQTMTPSELVFIDEKKLLKERMAARDIPEDILASDEEVGRRQQAQQAQEAAQQAKLEEEFKANIGKLIAGAFKDIALGRKADASATAESAQAIIEMMAAGADNGKDSAGTGKPAG